MFDSGRHLRRMRLQADIAKLERRRDVAVVITAVLAMAAIWLALIFVK